VFGWQLRKPDRHEGEVKGRIMSSPKVVNTKNRPLHAPNWEIGNDSFFIC
jgi:hypothetical protein